MTGTRKNPNLDLVNINAYTTFGKILSICSQNIERKQNLTSIKGHNSLTNLQKMTGKNPKLDLFNIMHIQNLIKFYQFVLNILSGNEILTSIKGHNSIKMYEK